MRATPNDRLAGVTSPYVLQHADNPVDWYPWGPAAFRTAQAEDKPVFLSVGYAACHWCHVMAHESFENSDVAEVLNRGFVSIKVDREERPDVDAIYMDAVQAMTGSGGWPMSVFLTPDGEPFFAGTYFPDQPRHGLPSFRQVLEGITDAWTDRRDEVLQQGVQVTDAIRKASTPDAEQTIDPAALPAVTAQAVERLHRAFDDRWGGFGGAPKFPQPTVLMWLLDRAARGDTLSTSMLSTTLMRMAAGGIHDHLGGGFARYSTDAMWHVPHFEKMLSDNAQLLSIFARAAIVTSDEGFAAVATGIGEWMLREMQQPAGGFSSSRDADSEGREGAFFVWSWDELADTAGEAVATLFGADRPGNWEGTNVLWRPRPVLEVAAEFGVDPDQLARDAMRARSSLLAVRNARPQPATDDKVIAAWNGLAIAGLATAGAALGEPRFTDAATRCAAFVWHALWDDANARLLRSWRGGDARIRGFADDYACVGLGFLALFGRTGQAAWFHRAIVLAEVLLERFGSPGGGFFQVGADDADGLVVRKLDLYDEPTPSGSAAAAELLVRIGRMTGDARFEAAAANTLALYGHIVERAPSAGGTALRVMDLVAGPTVEVVIAGDPSAAGTQALLGELVGPRRDVPSAIVGMADPADADAANVPLFEGRLSDDAPTAYVCERFRCQLPVTKPDELARQLATLLTVDLSG